MRVLFLTGREIGYARNQVLLNAFQRFADVDTIASTKKPRSLMLNSLSVAGRAAEKLARNEYDLIFVGFYGHLILQLLRPLIRTPLLFDAFLSTYDTLCFDRALFAPGSPMGRLAFRLDWSSIRRADRVLLDTEQHVDYFVETFKWPRSNFEVLPVGCDDTIYRPHLNSPARSPLTVLSYSTFLSLHGIDVILHAASKLVGEPSRIRLIGRGPAYDQMRTLADSLALANVTFSPPVHPIELAGKIADADICLGGHFNDSGKASRVIPGKIYQMLAVGRAVIAGNTPANRELLTHNQTAYLVPVSDADALAQAIHTLTHDHALRTRSGLSRPLAIRGAMQRNRHYTET